MKKLSEIFDYWYGVNLELVRCVEDKDGIPFVSRTSNNNGVVAKVLPIANIDPNPAHTLSLAAGGSVLSCFYQDEEYYSGRDLFVLSPKEEMSRNEMLLYSYIITKNKYKYNYGRQANRTFKDIILPELSEIKNIDYKNINTCYEFQKEPLSNKKIKLNTDKWQWFNYEDLFKVKGSKTTTLINLQNIYGKGEYPYVTTQSVNNGVEDYFDFYTEDGNVFTVDSAVVGYCAYQMKEFSASDHVEKLIPLFKCNIYIAMFIVTLINMEQYRYNYGRKCNQTKLKQSKIKLPATKDGKPDWQFMEDYIKSLPYSRNI